MENASTNSTKPLGAKQWTVWVETHTRGSVRGAGVQRAWYHVLKKYNERLLYKDRHSLERERRKEKKKKKKKKKGKRRCCVAWGMALKKRLGEGQRSAP